MRKFIDERGRLFSKVSVIDLGVLLLILLVIAGAFVQFRVIEPSGTVIEAAPIRYTLEITGVRDWTLNNIREGDTVFSGDTAVGTVVGVSAIPHQVLVSGGDGGLWWGEVPERYVVLVEVSATATVRDGRYLVSRTIPMGVGNSPAIFSTRFAEFTATVREIVPYDQ